MIACKATNVLQDLRIVINRGIGFYSSVRIVIFFFKEPPLKNKNGNYAGRDGSVRNIKNRAEECKPFAA